MLIFPLNLNSFCSFIMIMHIDLSIITHPKATTVPFFTFSPKVGDRIAEGK